MAKAGGVRAGRAFVDLGVKDRLAAGLKKARAKLRAFGASVSGIGRRMTIAGLAGGAAIGGAVKHFANFGDQVAKMSKRTGVSVQALTELGFAASQSGTSTAALEKALGRMQRSIYDAGRGLSTAVDGFKDLGLTVEDLEGLSPENQFKMMAEQISKVEDPTRKAALAMSILGRSGTQLLPMFARGAQGIEDLQAKARSLGISMSGKDAQAAEDLTDAYDQLWRTVKMGVFHIGGALAPAMTGFGEKATAMIGRITAWIQQNRALVVSLAKGILIVTAVGVALMILGKIIAAVGVIVAIVTSPITLIVVALGAVAAAFAYTALEGNSFGEKMGSLTAWLAKAWQWAQGAISAVMKWLRKAMAYAFAAMSFAAKHWKDLLKYALYAAIYGVVKFGGQLKHFFTVKIPAYLAWFRDNWRDVFTTIWNGLQTFAKNAWKNLSGLWTAIVGLFKGEGWSFEWTGLMDGFESAIKSLPEVAARAIGPAEKKLSDRLAGMRKKFAADWKDTLKDFLPGEAGPEAAGAGAQPERTRREVVRQIKKAAGGAARGMGKAAQTIVGGTFSADVRGLLGGGGPAERTAKATEEMAVTTRKMLKLQKRTRETTFT